MPCPIGAGFGGAVRQLFAALALILATGCTIAAGDDWTTGDTVRQAAVTAVTLIDFAQTRGAVKRPCGGVERPGYTCTPGRESGLARYFIGEHPSVGKVDTYFAASLLLNAAVAYALPPSLRRPFQYVSITFEVVHDRRNYLLGVKTSF